MVRFFTALAEATEAATEATQSGAQSMDMGRLLDVMLLAMLFGCAAYAFYTVVRLKREYMLFENKLLYPGNCPYLECTDPQSFIDFIWVKLLLLGIGMFACGALIALNSFTALFHNTIWISAAMIVLPLALFAWYVVIQRKAAKLFW